MWLKNRADSNAFNNLFAELWLRHAEEGVPSCNVTRIQLAILLKNQLLSMYFLGSWPQVQKFHFLESLSGCFRWRNSWNEMFKIIFYGTHLCGYLWILNEIHLCVLVVLVASVVLVALVAFLYAWKSLQIIIFVSNTPDTHILCISFLQTGFFKLVFHS